MWVCYGNGGGDYGPSGDLENTSDGGLLLPLCVVYYRYLEVYVPAKGKTLSYSLCDFLWYGYSGADYTGMAVCYTGSSGSCSAVYLDVAREQFAHYQALEEVYRQKEKEISEIRHDIANHLNVMEAMRADSYGMDILRRIDKNASVSFTDVPVLDCLIREKAEICQEKGIVFERKGQNLGSINITEYELVSLFANLLDNAVEAAIKTTEKKIFLTMEMQQGFLKIVLRNSKLENEAPLKTQFETTKKDKKKHGIGSRIIKEIVNDHDGRIRYIDHGTEMETVIFIAI